MSNVLMLCLISYWIRLAQCILLLGSSIQIQNFSTDPVCGVVVFIENFKLVV